MELSEDSREISHTHVSHPLVVKVVHRQTSLHAMRAADEAKAYGSKATSGQRSPDVVPHLALASATIAHG